MSVGHFYASYQCGFYASCTEFQDFKNVHLWRILTITSISHFGMCTLYLFPINVNIKQVYFSNFICKFTHGIVVASLVLQN